MGRRCLCLEYLPVRYVCYVFFIVFFFFFLVAKVCLLYEWISSLNIHVAK